MKLGTKLSLLLTLAFIIIFVIIWVAIGPDEKKTDVELADTDEELVTWRHIEKPIIPDKMIMIKFQSETHGHIEFFTFNMKELEQGKDLFDCFNLMTFYDKDSNQVGRIRKIDGEFVFEGEMQKTIEVMKGIHQIFGERW